MRAFGFALLLSALVSTPAIADDVTEALETAREAYDAGDIQYAVEELNFALQLLNELKAGNLQGFLPEPLEGWSREIDEELSTGMAMMGGGVGASAHYSMDADQDGESDNSFTLTLMADNPMVAAMSGMLGNTALISASGGKIIRVGREKFVRQDRQISALIRNRVLVQADGNNPDAIVAHLETMDFPTVANFGN